MIMIVRILSLVAIMLIPQAAGADAGAVAAESTPDYALVIGRPNLEPLSGEALEKETHKTSALLRCPVCQGLAVGDSPAPMAVNMRNEVRELHSRGYDQEQVITYFERAYGEFVRLEPQRKGINWFVWLAPVALLGIGSLVVVRTIRRLQGRPIPDAPSPSMDRQSEEIDPWLIRVRELARGEEPVDETEPEEPRR
jgi:cytochrome c-type biogenesis protein CcmH